MKKILLIALVGSFFFEGYAQMTVNGVSLPAKLKTSSTELTLNGAGVRKKAFFKVYVLGLFLKKKIKMPLILSKQMKKWQYDCKSPQV